MKIIAEKDRSFIDKGKTKLYSSFTGSDEPGSLHSIQKIVIQPEGKEKIERKEGLDYILIILSGTIEINGTSIKKDLILCDAAPVIGKESLKLTLKNKEEIDGELLLISVKNKHKNILHREIPVSYEIPLVSHYAENSTASKENVILISKKFYQPKDIFNYTSTVSNKTLCLYMISGEADINGYKMLYNDTAIFTPADDQIILAYFNKNTEILFIEIPL